MASGARYALFDRARPAVRNKSESLEMFVNKEEAICSRLFALSVLSTREVSRQIVGKWFRPFHFAHYPRSVAELGPSPQKCFDGAGRQNTLLRDQISSTTVLFLCTNLRRVV